MSYDKTLHNPYQGLREFGRAAAAGLGFNINPVTPDEGTFMLRKRQASSAPSSLAPKRLKFVGETVQYRSMSTLAPQVKRGRHGKYHRNLGRRPGAYHIRRYTTEGYKRDLVDKTFYSTRMISIPYSENEAVINARRGRLCNVRGLHLNCWFKFPFDTTSGTKRKFQAPIQVRWAVINPRENNGGFSLSTSDFFISKNPVEEMTNDFPSEGKCFDYMNRKINRELNDVVSQGMFVLHPPIETATARAFNTGTSGTDGAETDNNQRLGAGSFKKISVNIPIRKQMKWDSNQAPPAGDFPDQNLYFCWWYCQMGDDSVNKRYNTTLTPVRADWEITNYFTNSKMFS